MSLRSLLIHTCDVLSRVDTKSEPGFANKTGSLVRAEDVPCRFDSLPKDVAIMYGRDAAADMRRVIFDTDQSLTMRDQLRWNGTVYDVRSVQACYASGTTPYLWEVDVQRRALGGA